MSASGRSASASSVSMQRRSSHAQSIGAVKLSTARMRRRKASSGSAGSCASSTPDGARSTSSSSLPTLATDADSPYDDAELVERARQVHAELDLSNLDVIANDSAAKWRWVAGGSALSVFTRSRRPNEPEVLCHGRVDGASLQELAGVLHSASDRELAANMAALYGKAFIFGSVDRSVRAAGPSRAASTPEALSTPYAAGTPSEEREDATGEAVAVKTATFVHADRFGRRNEQWCFLERFARKPERDGFSLSMSSLRPLEDGAAPGKLDSARVDQLHGLSAACLVEAVPPSASAPAARSPSVARGAARSVRVVFYARYDGGDASGAREAQASAKLARARLVMLAKGLTRLPELVRRRRFGMQKLADRSTLRVKNPRCTCCTKKFRALLARKKRCYLCGFFVCDDCWSLEQMETYNGHLVGIVICTRCAFCVDACDFSEVGTRAEDRAPVRVRADAEAAPPSVKSQTLVGYLEKLLLHGAAGAEGSSSSSLVGKQRQRAVVSLIRTMLDDVDQSEVDTEVDTEADADAVTSKPAAADGHAMLGRVGSHLSSSLVPLEQCVLANDGNRRSYPLAMPATPQELLPSPVPHDEARRLELIDRWELREVTDVPELEILCELASLELQVPSTLFTIMTRDVQVVLSSDVAALQRATFHRDQTCCQHTIMTSRPVALRYLTADARLQSIPTIKQMNVQFYCGYPVLASDGTVLGTMCSFDTRPHGDLSQTQYSHMRELARTASVILEREAKRRLQARPS